MCDVYGHCWISKEVTENVSVKQRQNYKFEKYSTLAHNELSLKDNAFNMKKGMCKKAESEKI